MAMEAPSMARVKTTSFVTSNTFTRDPRATRFVITSSGLIADDERGPSFCHSPLRKTAMVGLAKSVPDLTDAGATVICTSMKVWITITSFALTVISSVVVRFSLSVRVPPDGHFTLVANGCSVCSTFAVTARSLQLPSSKISRVPVVLNFTVAPTTLP